MRHESVISTIGNTPLVSLDRICGSRISAKVYGKVESFNPGQSAKDRAALYMIEQAEKKGRIQPGATLIEATSGNTGFSIAMIAAVKGYKCVLTLTDKAGPEKRALLTALGAEIVLCPAAAEPEDPASYYSQAERLAADIPNSFYLRQNWNLDNSNAHYYSTGPEIWNDTDGKVTHYVCCAGTGGTLSGTARYLKEKNPNVTIVGVDAYGSVLKKYWQTGIFDADEIFSWKVEGLGKTIIPDNVAFDLIDEFIKVGDRAAALRVRELARREGMLLGYSSGAALEAVFAMRKQLTPDDVVVVLFPDHGSRYLGKVFNDEWMKEQGYLRPNGEPAAYSVRHLQRMYRVYKRMYGRKIKERFNLA
ncbi:cysteine synthase family protein [Neolewinella lacunae]|uniref:Cysteine synthase family protein n=1 Tax=Neolewinella lacunae TaxID=1517758 RepID=A0A923T7T1_9BACT|nr:cysteine synthase family protein [Neolewinella lacunae]MBC6993879.1 cysteine synthase family protein [Neolewinella lacunae]MDN3637060.1 cysteine synthase family protein [Neolewinella lacunae]